MATRLVTQYGMPGRIRRVDRFWDDLAGPCVEPDCLARYARIGRRLLERVERPSWNGAI